MERPLLSLAASRGALSLDTGRNTGDQGETSTRERRAKRREIDKEEREKWGREREGEEKEKVSEEDSGRTEDEINRFKQVLSVIYICLQNEKCVP